MIGSILRLAAPGRSRKAGGLAGRSPCAAESPPALGGAGPDGPAHRVCRYALVAALALLGGCQAIIHDEPQAPLQVTAPPAVRATLEARPQPTAIVVPLGQHVRGTPTPAATAETGGTP